MTDIILFDYWRSSASYRVRIALNLKGVAYETVDTSLSREPLERATTLAQAMVVAADIHPVNNLRILKYLKNELGQDQEAVDRWYRHWITEGFAALEAMAPESGLFGGNRPNLADICLVPQIYNARRFATDLSAFPRLVRIDAACNEMEAFQNAAPEAVKPA